MDHKQFAITAALCAVIICLLVFLIIFVIKKSGRAKDNTEQSETLKKALEQEMHRVLADMQAQNSLLRQEISAATQNSVKNFSEVISRNQDTFSREQTNKMSQLEERFKTFSLENEQKLDLIRSSVEKRLMFIQEDNAGKLDQMRATVDEKLQKTLDERMTRSFSLVNERLEQVYKGLGEMQTLANGVGDLKKVLSNVKTRGILGEIQLSAILREILSPDLYDENVATKKGSKNVVEFAVKLPHEDNSFIYLPIDSKFPGDTYAKLQQAYENGNADEIELAAKQLVQTLKSEARDIRDKYIDPPNTTDFAVMFLPFEGLYAEAVNRGMVEVLQRDYKVNIAGPSTMAALLNSLQMGFKTLAVQKRSAEVWKVLSDVKKEFDSFYKVLEATQTRLSQANTELDKLVGVRTRQIQKKLSAVQTDADLEEPKD